MPLLPPIPAIYLRRDDLNLDSTSFAETHDHGGVIVGVVVSIVGLAFAAIFFVFLFLPWLRRCRQARASKQKALIDQQAWYRSTRPVVHQESTPRLLDAYTVDPHIQRYHTPAPHLRTGVNDYSSGVLHDSLNGSHDSRPPSIDIGSEGQGVTTLNLVPTRPTSSEHQDSMHSCYDLGLQNLDNRESRSTTTTCASIGVGVAINIPSAVTPVEVYNGHKDERKDKKDDHDAIFVVGDDE